MKQISPRVLYLERADWGARTDIPRLGEPLVPRGERVYNIKHHIVGVDSDETKNIWENLDEVKEMMKRLQVIRPDLGNDVPYNWVKFLMADHSIVVCEGRGYDRWGAHTAGVVPGRSDPYRYFNGCGVATSYAGNFEDYPTNFDPWKAAINDWNRDLKWNFPNLGKATVCGQPTCGHKHFAPYSTLNQTACPGMYLYAFLPQIRLDAPEEEDDMKAMQLLYVAGTFEFLASDIEQGFPLNPAVCKDVLDLVGHDGPVKAVDTKEHAHGLLVYASAETKRNHPLNDQATQEIRGLAKRAGEVIH